MRTSIKALLDFILNPMGLSLERYFGAELALQNIIRNAAQNQVDLVLDVGANTGQYALKMFKYGYKGKLISFEPLSTAHATLLEAARKNPNWEVYERCALGDKIESSKINVSQNSHSSSILQVNAVHVEAAPSAAFMHSEDIQIKTLDSIKDDFQSYHNIFLKIDTQGFEMNVLRGAEQLIKNKVKLIQLEISLLPLYQDGASFTEIMEYMSNMGFEALFFSPGYIDRHTDQIQQIEGFFIRKKR